MCNSAFTAAHKGCPATDSDTLPPVVNVGFWKSRIYSFDPFKTFGYGFKLPDIGHWQLCVEQIGSFYRSAKFWSLRKRSAHTGHFSFKHCWLAALAICVVIGGAMPVWNWLVNPYQIFENDQSFAEPYTLPATNERYLKVRHLLGAISA
ncbi:hypothetical protein, partial [Methylomonas koyamae]|uniref:hypothetical protein n=2 Tax=Methylomonas TaxID=416 RepID=UPI0012F705AF